MHFPRPDDRCVAYTRQDRAALVARDLFLVLGVTPPPRLRQYIENWLRDEFAEERWLGICDRELPDA